jgi:hypothetical protein
MNMLNIFRMSLWDLMQRSIRVCDQICMKVECDISKKCWMFNQKQHFYDGFFSVSFWSFCIEWMETWMRRLKEWNWIEFDWSFCGEILRAWLKFGGDIGRNDGNGKWRFTYLGVFFPVFLNTCGQHNPCKRRKRKKMIKNRSSTLKKSTDKHKQQSTELFCETNLKRDVFVQLFRLTEFFKHLSNWTKRDITHQFHFWLHYHVKYTNLIPVKWTKLDLNLKLIIFSLQSRKAQEKFNYLTS